MKVIAANVLFVMIWVLIGHYAVVFLYTPIFFGLLYGISHWRYKYGVSEFAVIPFSYALILLDDYLFRLYACGNHDDEGKGWFALIFGITLIVTTLILLSVYLSKAIDGEDADVNGKHGRLIYGTLTIGLVLLCSVLTGAIFTGVFSDM